MVVVFRITHGNAVIRGLGQLGLNPQDGLRLFLRRGIVITQQLQHVGYMHLVFLAGLLRLGVIFDVVIAIGKPQSSLAHSSNVHAGVVQVRLRAKAEKDIHIQRVHVSHGFNKLVFIGNRGNALQQRLECGTAQRIDGFLIHAGGIEIPDLLRDGVTFRIVRGRFLQNLMQQLPVIFGQFIEAAPACLVRWNWIVPAPCAAGVLIEVFAWIYGLIHRTQVERLGT